MKVKSLGYLGLESPHPSSWVGFARDIVGMCVRQTDDGSVLIAMDDRAYRMAVHPGAVDRLAYLGFEVESRVALKGMFDHVVARGFGAEWATEQKAARREVEGLMTFTDPAGFNIEVFCGAIEKPRSRPRSATQYLTGELGLGHALLLVPDLARYEEFLLEALGFRITDTIRTGSAEGRFYHCNRRHHSITMAEVPGHRGLHHVMVEVSDLDDVGEAYDRAKKHGLVTYEIGRHTNDRMVSFYVRTPSGFSIEYGWGGRLVDDDSWLATTYDRSALWGHEKRGDPPVLLEALVHDHQPTHQP